jgi:hypothetical protein
MSFNHGVVGSNPAGLTNKIKSLIPSRQFTKNARVRNMSALALPGWPAALDKERKKESWRSMAKQTKKAKGIKSGLARNILPAPSPSQEDFERARELLGQRADALILDLAKRYQAGKAAELTTVLDAIDSLSEIERLQRA